MQIKRAGIREGIMMCKCKGGCKSGCIMKCKLKGWMDNGEHYDVQIISWMEKGTL